MNGPCNRIMIRHGASDRAQVGIGTLAVFIAILLIVMLAAGVLIETVGLLEHRCSVKH